MTIYEPKQATVQLPRVRSLLSAVPVVDPDGELFTEGVSVLEEQLEAAVALAICDEVNITGNTSNIEDTDVVTSDAIVLSTSVRVSSANRGLDGGVLARRQLLRTQSQQIANEWLLGTAAAAGGLTNFRILSSVDDVNDTALLNSTTATEPTEALARLEETAANYNGGRAVVLAPVAALTYWADRGLLTTDGTIIETYAGTRVAVDPGFNGAAPGGTVPASFASRWAYIAPMPTIRLSNIVEHLVDYGENVSKRNIQEWRAARSFTITMPTKLVYAVNVNTSNVLV